MSPSMRFAERARGLWRFLVQTGRLIVGVPDYDLYVTHMHRTHRSVRASSSDK